MKNALLFVVFGLVSGGCLMGQSGFVEVLDFGVKRTYACNLALKGHDQIFICGVYLHETTGAQGLFFSIFDTSGVLVRTDYFEDMPQGRSLDYAYANEIGIVDDDSFLIPVAYLESGSEGLICYSDTGIRLLPAEYIQDERTEIYRRIWCDGGNYFVLGHAQRQNYRADILFMRLDTAGRVEVRKKIGYYSLNDYYGDSYIDGDGNFVVLGTRASDDYIVDEKKIKGWAKPFIMKLDTAGNILDQWFGEENDPRVLFGRRFFMTPDSGHVIIGKDYKEVPHVIGTIVYSSPTICKLDKDQNLLWKHTLSDFETTREYLADLAYCPVTNTYVTAGMIGAHYGDVLEDEILVLKFDDDGNILWNFRETIGPNQQWRLHDVGGVVVSSTGSIYVAGRQYQLFEEPPNISWLMKVTPDGCIDTICTTTAIEEQIAARQGWQVVFPNPVRDEIRIIMPEADLLPMTMAVFDMQGRIVDRIQVTERQQSFKVDWQPGMYGYQLIHKGAPEYVGKLVKME